MKTEIVATRPSGGNYNLVVRVDGLDSLMRFLKDSDPQMREAIRQGLREAATPVLARARANAYRIADDGTFASSLSIRSYVSGRVVLRSSGDEAAGVKEFAHQGAKTISSKGTPLANARLRMRSGVGVPLRANHPRVMVPAVNDSAEDVKTRIDAKLEEVLRRADG